jgi:dihydroxy-acid dehydratase
MSAQALRSDEWFTGHDETAVAHRAALRSAGALISAAGGRPVIGIADTSSELNPCNLPLRDVIASVRGGVVAAGGIPLVFPMMSLGEDLMKPSAMLYRNLMAIEVEETLRSYPVDGVVLLANCDKTVPACLMGAASADLPAIMVIGGSRPEVEFRGRSLRSGTDLWTVLDDYRAGRLSEAEWNEFEACYSCGTGSCNTMGTASSMAIMAEVLGMALDGSSLTPATDPDRATQAFAAGRRAVELVTAAIRPSEIMTPDAFRGALAALCAAGGSTNAVLHLCAIAGRLGFTLPLEWINEVAASTPVIADIVPAGRLLVHELHAAGGVPALLAALGRSVSRGAVSVTRLPSAQTPAQPEPSETPKRAPAGQRAVLRDPSDPVRRGPPFVVVRGTLAPDGALLKACAADPRLFQHRGPALVFHGYHDMRARMDDPELDVTPDTVLVLAGCGPVGVPGMPEWGMIPIPVKLAAEGVTDMVRITDARMSGTSFGTCFLHVAPEAAVGGPLALVQDGDQIVVDVRARRLDLDVPADEIERRRIAWAPPPSPHLRGWPALYQRTVLQAPDGCDLDFLRARSELERRPVPPIVGRS